MAKKKNASLYRMLAEMVVLVAAVVILSTMVWNQLKPSEDTLVNPPAPTDETPPPSEETPPSSDPTEPPAPQTPQDAMEAYANANGFTLEDYKMGFDYYPEKLYDAYEKCPEARDFILKAPLEYQKNHGKDMSDYENVEGVPLFMQWDDRWGYTPYAYGLGGITGCGPTCLSMVVCYYTQDFTYTPDYMMKFAEENNYIGRDVDADGKLHGGTEWILFSKGGPKLGFDVKEVPLDENTLARHLKAGRPVICHLGECKFTFSGHYIVLTGIDENGHISVNDPNSRALSAEGCTYDEIEDAIKNMWVLTPKSA